MNAHIFIRLLTAMPLLMALVACSKSYDGRYGLLDKNGEIRRNSSGEPMTTLTVEGESAALTVMGETKIYRATVIDNKLHIVPTEGPGPTLVMHKDGDQLVTESGGRENRMARMQ